ncbi:GSCOCG00005186001-RA-CDS [Cotesia congregata]|uniref:Uncharacterized protein n=1 Tax=Cotesia congregata TaxID=51543 RepID=A0A8J2MPK0_COTCN|nr:GSCOCG00005186001-RA-CDS [Cotesia congregata]CAG5101942.1 Protein of unknown function [Cotesia congregata]
MTILQTLFTEVLHALCKSSKDCEIVFSGCYERKCKCKPDYIEHENACYGGLYSKCFKPSDCLSTSFSCKSGICQYVEYAKYGKILSSKPEVRAYWVHRNHVINATEKVFAGTDLTGRVYVCRGTKSNITIPGKVRESEKNNPRCRSSDGYFDIEYTDYDILISSDVEWRRDSSYTPDKAVYAGKTKDNKPVFICRVWSIHHLFVGMLDPPLYKYCLVPYYDLVLKGDNFEVLVHK